VCMLLICSLSMYTIVSLRDFFHIGLVISPRTADRGPITTPI
jgi:hypothetical protein